MRIVFHIDVNSAFLSWTASDLLKKGYKFDIRDKVSVISYSETSKGIITASSTPAKKLGISGGMPMFQARKKSKEILVFKPDYNLYERESAKMFNFLRKYTPDIEVASIDECYLEYTKVENLYGDYLEFAKKIQKEISDQLGFTVNIGIGNNKLTAKMAGELEKPNKIHTIFDNEIETKMHNQKIERLFGVGKQTWPKLKQIGINTIGDLAAYDETRLSRIFKTRTIDLINRAKGIDNSEIDSEAHIPKGISNERTFARDITELGDLYKYLFFLSDTIGIRIRNEKKQAGTIAIIIKDTYFRRRSHQRKLMNPTDITSEIYNISKELLNKIWDNEPLRLIGIRLDNLVEASNSEQLSLFDSDKDREEEKELDSVLDNINHKFGNVITKASLIDNKMSRGKKVTVKK